MTDTDTQKTLKFTQLTPMTMKLSDPMREALQALKQHGYLVANYQDRTMLALERRGLARWYPYARRECFQGIWKACP